MGETLFVAAGLRLESNPFDTGDAVGRLGRPLQKTLGEVIRQIGLETPVVVVPGSTGTGKTLLANMAERVCADMGLSIRRIHRGDFVEVADGQRSDVLLVDEADSIADSTLHMLLFEGDKRLATTTVLLCLPASLRRFSTVGDVVVVELTRLSQSDTRHYLQERATYAGFPDLFTPAAFDLIVDGSRGVPRSLWSIASLAYFYAASRGASQVGRDHVAHALASQIAHPEIPEAALPAAPPVANAQHTTANVAVFKRGNSAEPPTHQLPREHREAPAGSMSAAVTPAVETEIGTLDPIPWPMSDLQKSIAAALNRSAAPDDELPIDDETTESPKESIGFARANAATEGRATRQLSAIVGGALGAAIALAAAVALTIFVQPAALNEKAAVATGGKNIAVTTRVANQPSTNPAKPADAAGQAIGKSGAANRTTGLSNPGRSATNESLIPPKTATTRATQRSRRTRTAPVPALAAAPPAPTTAAMLVPLENNTVTTASVEPDAATDIRNGASSAEADAAAAIAAQQQAEHDRIAREAAVQAQAAAIREANAKYRANALAEAAALAEKEEKERKTRTDFKPRYRLYQ